jgi:hypothetical protein
VIGHFGAFKTPAIRPINAIGIETALGQEKDENPSANMGFFDG